MTAKLKPLSQQVLVVAGALSPVGQETARLAARKGAAVVITAQDDTAIRKLADSLNAAGGRAHPVAADLADAEAAAKVARAAAARFGQIDTWISTGGEGGQASAVNGSKAAVRYFEGHKGAGALVVIGAPQDSRPITEELRNSLRKSKAQVSVTLVRRGASPRAMARAVLYAAQHDVRDLSVGARGRRMTATETGVVVGIGAIALAAAAYLARGAIAPRARPALARARRSALRGRAEVERLAIPRLKGAARAWRALR